MLHIHGTTITLVTTTQTGTDRLNRPIYETTPIEIDNVLVGEPSTEDITSSVNLSGHKVHYTLGIPKGDEHEWAGHDVILPAPWSVRCRVVGDVIEGIEANIPLAWNRKVKLERYD